MKKMLIVSLMLTVVLAVPAFACGGSKILDVASFVGVMGVSQGVGSSFAEAYNMATATIDKQGAKEATTTACSTGTTMTDYTGDSQVMAIQFGAALAMYSSDGLGSVSGTFTPMSAGSVATFGVTW